MRGSVLALVLTIPLAFAAGPVPEPGSGVVAADHGLASGCGASLLAAGGNAADAAVGAALCAGVVQPAGSGLGGGGFALVVGPGVAPVVLDFREVAPGASTRDLFVRPDGTVDVEGSKEGGRAVAVPAESRGLARVLEDHGRLSPAVVARPARDLAARGFRVEPHLAASLSRAAAPEVRQAWSVGGVLPRAGDSRRNPALAGTLARWAASGGEALHTGRDAAALLAHVTAAGGILSADDLSGVEVIVRAPIVVPWRGYTLVTMPPPSSGGVAIAQVLRVLEDVDLVGLGHNSSAYLHRLTEALKHAMADRAHHLGDPAFVDVPVARLLSDDRVGQIRSAFDPDRTLAAEAYGPLIPPPTDAGTQHISVLDADGMAVALTTTINTSFGAGLVPPGLGVVLNDEMDDFAVAPGVPNAYGLVGSEANAVAPGKRPLSSMSPTVVLDGTGTPVLVVGASGGSRILTATLQVILDVLVFGMNPADAVAAPRVHHQWQPDVLSVEPEIPRDVIAALEARGHRVVVERSFAAVQAVAVTPDGTRLGASDPRKGGRAAGAW